MRSQRKLISTSSSIDCFTSTDEELKYKLHKNIKSSICSTDENSAEIDFKGFTGLPGKKQPILIESNFFNSGNSSLKPISSIRNTSIFQPYEKKDRSNNCSIIIIGFLPEGRAKIINNLSCYGAITGIETNGDKSNWVILTFENSFVAKHLAENYSEFFTDYENTIKISLDLFTDNYFQSEDKGISNFTFDEDNTEKILETFKTSLSKRNNKKSFCNILLNLFEA